MGRRMAEESTPIQDSDRSVRGFFFSLFSFLIAAIFSRFALNDAGRSMVTTLVARILEDPQLRDKQINLSWTTTIGEVCNDMLWFFTNVSFFGGVILSHMPQVFHDTGAINVHPNYYDSTLLDLLVHDGRCGNSYLMPCIKSFFKPRIPNEQSAYEIDTALDFIDSMWTRQVDQTAL